MWHDSVLVLAQHSWWHTYGEWILWAAAITTAISVMFRTKPTRWVWRQLVAGPTTDWLGREVRNAVAEEIGHEFVANGGTSVRDLLDGMADNHAVLSEFATEAKEHQVAIEGKVDQTRSAIVDMSAGISTTLADHGGRITSLEGGHAAVLEAVKKLHKCIDERLPPIAGASEKEAS